MGTNIIIPPSSAGGDSILSRPFPMGVDVDTKEPVLLSLLHFIRSYWCVGEIGIGKSNHILAVLYAMLRTPLPGAIFDGAGTLVTHLFNAVVGIACGRLIWADRFPDFRRQALAFVLRHPLIIFGDACRNISINFLARQRLPSGEMETLENVALRTYQVFNRLFAADADKRVRFRRVAMCVIAILAAAGRPIRDYKKLLVLPDRGRNAADPGGLFLARCLQEAEALGIPAVDRAFFEDSVRSFQDLRRLPPAQFHLETESTDNAFNYFYTSPGGDYVNHQTLDLPALLAGGGKLLLSHTLPDLTLAAMLFRAYDSIIRTWVRGREPLRRPTPYGIQVVDEPFWIDSSVSDDWAIQRNKRWGVILLNQHRLQLEQVSPGLSELMESYAKLKGEFRPNDMDRATHLAYLLRRFRPDSLQIPYQTRSTAETSNVSKSLGDSWSETLSESESEGDSGSSGITSNVVSSSDEGSTLDPETGEPRALSKGAGSSGSQGETDVAGWSTQKGKATALMTGTQSGSSTGTSAGETWNELLHFVPIAEQATDFAQELLRTPEHTIFMKYGGKARRIALHCQREYPSSLFGQPVGEFARAFQQRIYERQNKVAPAENVPNVVSPEPSAPSPSPAPPDAAQAAETAASPAVSEVAAPPPPPPPTATAPPATPSGPAPTEPPPASEPRVIVDGPDGTRVRLGTRDAAILAAAADWRFITLDHLRLDSETFGGYSGITDRVKLLTSAGLLGKMQPPAPRGTGSNPIRYFLTRAGAHALADLTGRQEDRLRQIAENVARVAAQVDRLELGQLPHLLAVADSLASASASIRTLPGLSLATTRFDKEVVLEIPTTDVEALLTPAIRRRLSIEDGRMTMTFRPDALLVVSLANGSTLPLLVEVETGRKETNFEEFGLATAIRTYAAIRSNVITAAVQTLGFSAVAPARVLTLAASADLEARLVAGASTAVAALGSDLTAMLRFSTIDLACPKAPPVSRAARAQAFALIAASFVSPIWTVIGAAHRRSLLD